MANLGYIQVTRSCNQHCLFCSNPELQATLQLDEAKGQIDQLVQAGYDGVILTGGEPTLHPDLPAIVRLAREAGIQVRLISNGQHTAEPGVLEDLVSAGLDHLHLSIHSSRRDVQDYLTQNPGSLSNIEKTLERIGRLRLTCDINTVMCAQNADHLDQTVAFVIEAYGFVKHFVWNNIDPTLNRVCEHPETVARLADLELSLHRAVGLLEATGRTFRIERLPLCYMADFAWASTETRKIVKGEQRRVHFLDDKGEVNQTSFVHDKAEVCSHCRLDRICAGLYDAGGAYDPAELHAVFLDPDAIAATIRGE